jgi:membrane-bound lytic murein transglycosylase D
MSKYAPFIAGLSLIVFIGLISFSLLNSNKPVKPASLAYSDAEVEMAVEKELKHRLSSDDIIPQPQIVSKTGLLSNIPIILPIPENLDFCGERVPLEDPDILERFERELYITAQRSYQVVFYLKRGGKYFPEMEQILREEKAPLDLIYLSAIESDLIPTIRSPKGALGLWQFMPETAKRYRLTVNKYVDERMHTDKSTRAAVKYLREAKDKFGSWTLAAAAYNMGFARTSKTIAEQRTSNYYKIHINQETSRYVFRILAVKAILENPELYGYYIPKSESYKQEKTKKIVVKQSIPSLPVWLQKYNLTYYDLKRLNPWVVSTSLPKGVYIFELPI